MIIKECFSCGRIFHGEDWPAIDKKGAEDSECELWFCWECIDKEEARTGRDFFSGQLK